MKIANILLGLAVAVAVCSCDNFLDVKPTGKVIPKTYEDFRAMITTAYNGVSYDRSLTALRSDEALLDESAFAFESLKDVYTWIDATADANTMQFPWLASYQVIFVANHIIDEGENATDGTQDQIDQLLGEAHLLRAYMHFNLVNLFADQYGESDPTTQKGVPIVTSIDLEKIYRPNTVAEVYAQVIDDINKGISLLNVGEQPKGYNYRFSKVSAYGFAARVYLNMKEYSKAAEYAQKALDINGKLENLNSSSAVMPCNFKSSENILAMEQTFASNIASDVSASSTIVGLFDRDNDNRFAAYFSESDGKYMVLLGGKPDNRVSMRTAEFYLIKAEAIARSNERLTDAKSALKILLKNRLKPDYYTQRAAEIDALGKDEFVQAIFDERARELAFQGFRWFDLKRNGKPELIKELGGQTFILKKNDNRYVLRFPKDAIANNPYLLN